VIVSLIVAMDETRGIGKHNRLPWHLPSDLKRFKKLTMGHHLVMGRKTYETIRKPLPGRKMIVISHQPDYVAPGCQVVQSISQALRVVEDYHETEVFIIGGGEIFTQSVGIADKIYLTAIHADVDADVKFPIIDYTQWEMIYREVIPQDESDEYRSDFMIYARKH
jgi:dihydrofolate reductase